MENLRLLHVVESALGKGSSTSRGNYAFYCPFCNHHKKKLEINLNTTDKGENPWNCWTCPPTNNAKGRKLYTLIKRLKVNPAILEKLKKIIGDVKLAGGNEPIRYNENLVLPEEFIPLWQPNKKSPDYRHAIKYLIKERGLTVQDILKYQIGYCEKGDYSGMVIIPSYDKDGQLNFFTGRSFYDTEWKHKNPSWSKDIIGFELFINWQLPIVIVESTFDAISVKRNAVPLFGKNVMDELKLKLVENNAKDIYIALDPDAFSKSLDVAEYFMNNGINVYVLDLLDKDPNEWGFENLCKIVKDTEPLTFMKLMEYKLFRI